MCVAGVVKLSLQPSDSYCYVLYVRVMIMCVPVFMCSQGAAAYPENEDQQQRLREAAEGLRVATNAAAQNAIKKKLVNRLEVSHWSQHALIYVLFDLDQNTALPLVSHTGKDIT